jgi:TolA-binding protein
MTVRKKLLLMLLCLSSLPVVSPGSLHAQPQPRDDARQQFADPMERIEAAWMERQQEMDLRLEQWEGEQEHRRQEEGENFDEAAYAFQKSLMARRRGLAERRMRLDVETHLAYRALDQAQQELEEEAQAYFGERQRSNMEAPRSGLGGRAAAPPRGRG